jgi:hypothetical protein
MGTFVCNGANIKCMFGDAPASLIVIHPGQPVQTCNQFAANIMDYKPFMNIPTFGSCKSMANPTVASATAANKGVLTPMPCIPNTVAPWIPGEPTVLVKGMPALLDNCKLMCMWAGTIEVVFPGQMTVMT